MTELSIMIEAVHLEKNFGNHPAVRDVSFRVAKGEVAGFLGPNGAGKTTTLRMLTTFLPPSGGHAYVDGKDVALFKEEARRKIGYLPEVPPLYDELTVEEYLRFVAEIKGVSRSKMRGVIDDAIELCSLQDMRRRLCRQLSRGYRQRTGLAQAVLNRPPIVILDEPTNGLDPQQVMQIRELISCLAGEHTVVLSTHILAEVSMICSKVVIFKDGRVVREECLSSLTKQRSLEEVFLECVSS